MTSPDDDFREPTITESTATTSTPATNGSRLKRRWLPVALLTATAMGAAIFVATRGSNTSSTDPGDNTPMDPGDSRLIVGSWTLFNSDGQRVTGSWDDCRGAGEYGDFGPGQSVLVYDTATGEVLGETEAQPLKSANNAIIGLIAIANGASHADELRSLLEANSGSSCMTYFSLSVQRSGHTSYSVNVGGSGYAADTADIEASVLDQGAIVLSVEA